MRSPSPEVVAAVERAMLCHAICDCLPDSATRAEMRSHVRVEVTRLTAERDALAAAHARESEKVWKVEEVMDDIEGSDPTTWERLRAALAEPTDQEA